MSELWQDYRSEILLHCYRLTGSYFDAEDMVQETFLRAWKGRSGLRDGSAARAWLYRIATNVCLSQLKRRRLPQQLALPSELLPVGDGSPEVEWLTPFPGPEASLESAENVRLAFVAALQMLPPRQRSVLLLRDVLDWSAQETADILQTSLASVTSALQRARANLARQSIPPDKEPDAELLARYLRAWEGRDMDSLMQLLHDDASLAMPPYRQWYQGSKSIRRLWQYVWDHCVPPGGRFELVRYNGQSAVLGRALQMLRTRAGLISEITVFLDPRFGRGEFA